MISVGDDFDIKPPPHVLAECEVHESLIREMTFLPERLEIFQHFVVYVKADLLLRPSILQIFSRRLFRHREVSFCHSHGIVEETSFSYFLAPKHKTKRLFADE